MPSFNSLYITKCPKERNAVAAALVYERGEIILKEAQFLTWLQFFEIANSRDCSYQMGRSVSLFCISTLGSQHTDHILNLPPRCISEHPGPDLQLYSKTKLLNSGCISQQNFT